MPPSLWRSVPQGVLAALLALALIGPVSPLPARVVHASTAGNQQGVDVSNWQHPSGQAIDWNAVLGAGYTFAYIKATEMTSSWDYENPYFQQDWNAALAAGVRPGAYMYFHPSADGVQQANLFLQQLRAVGMTGGALDPVIDVETLDSYSKCDARTTTSLQQVVTTLQQALQQMPEIYAAPSWWDSYICSSSFTSDPLWEACWGSTCPTDVLPSPANDWGGNGWGVWQYTDLGSVPGIHSTNVDHDQSNSNMAIYQAPLATLTAPATSSTTAFAVSWSPANGSLPISSYTIWTQDGSGVWLQWLSNTTTTSATFYGITGHTYNFFAQANGTNGVSALAPGAGTIAQGTTALTGATNANPFIAMYAVDGYGGIHPAASPPVANSNYWPGWNIVRGMQLDSDGQGGQILDGFGGLHPFGNAPFIASPGYWPNWDIARAIALIPGSSTKGYTLDGWGGLHAFGGAPSVSNAAWFPGWDIMKGLAVCSSGTGGYSVDGWGGVHPFGTASGVQVTGYWPGWNIARGIVVNSTCDGGYTDDGYGGVHPFGTEAGKGVQTNSYWPNWDIARAIVLLPGSDLSGYVVDGYGGFHPWAASGATMPPGVPLSDYRPGAYMAPAAAVS